ncbi:MAG TPA: Wzz/FepE/Etk N-terminal domain-containing protein, partial [Gemmatimonadaceae bacterium]|nr:Wzz/FepE/Etk N-terminal domain-containing protein [Gemmatimonadaceae bacterium]
MYDATLRTVEATPHPSTRAALPGDAPRSSGSPSRSIWRVVRRHVALIVASGVVAAAVAAIVTSRLRPVYSATATIGVDTRLRASPIQDLLRATSGNEVNTEVEVLRSRTLAAAVVDSLGLQLTLREPGGVLRSALLTNILVAHDASPARYVLRRSSPGIFSVDSADGGSPRTVRVGERYTLGGATMELLPAAGLQSVIELETMSLDDAVDSLQ